MPVRGEQVNMDQGSKLYVVYDGECPFCKQYSKMVRIQKNVGEVILIDVRNPSAILDEVTALRLDIERGMVVKFAEKIYYGADAINILSVLSSRSDLFNRINYYLFKSKALSYIFYPLLRDYRNIALWILNIPKIDNLKMVKK